MCYTVVSTTDANSHEAGATQIAHTPGIEVPCSPTGEMLADGWTEHTYHPPTTHSPMINDKLLRASDGEVIAIS